MEATHEEALDAVIGGPLPVSAGTQAVAGSNGGVLKGVLAQLKAEGGFSPIQLIALIPAIVDLIVEVGPQIAEIVRKVKELFGKK